jgi:hypothetical protein
MTYEESQRLKQQLKELMAVKMPEVREAESGRFRLAAQEEREYLLSFGHTVEVNPVEQMMFCSWVQVSLVSLQNGEPVPSVVWRELSEVVAMYEAWKAGIHKDLPPSGTWEDAKAWFHRETP